MVLRFFFIPITGGTNSIFDAIERRNAVWLAKEFGHRENVGFVV